MCRVKNARVEADGAVTGQIGPGLLIYLGVGGKDIAQDAHFLADRVGGLRIFQDENGKMNLSGKQTGAQMLAVSNFTLYANCRSRRPDFMAAARPQPAVELFSLFVQALRDQGYTVATGRFGAEMQVLSQADGPVTLWLDTEEMRAGN